MSSITASALDGTARRIAARPVIAAWLSVVLALLFVMIIVGGLTRLTDSGLSIVEWRPVTGVVPPLSEDAWAAEFDKYRQIPEYQLQNRGMSLDEFKTIYWWEWGHRFLGRVIGLAFFVPFVIFLLRGQIERGLKPRLWLMFALGGAQGALGWFMVMSGLTERLDVSQYRLAAHLGLAFIIFGFIWWTLLDLLRPEPTGRADLGTLPRWTKIFAALVFVQILLGALVAGIDAGRLFNTWPLMEGGLAPSGLFALEPWWANFGENHGLVQFQHRMAAYGITVLAIMLWLWGRRIGLTGRARATGDVLLGIVAAQMLLGIATLLLHVPIGLAAAHQAGAAILLAAALAHIHALERLRGRRAAYLTPA